ncbi:MAG: glycosyltransferase family 87 protein [Hyphomicrobiaceae bacterium]
MSSGSRLARLDGRRLPAAWTLVAATLTALALLLVGQQARFDWSLPLIEIPAPELTLGLVAAGIVFLALLPLVHATAAADRDLQRRLLLLVVSVGLLLRLLMLQTEPALEDDQQRYLWEGGLAAHGFSPYAVSPDDAKRADRSTALGQLAEAAGPVLERVNHPHLKTIYPPVAIATFALAHGLAPFSLTAWRLVLLAADGATLLLILALLRETGRAPIWSALYWWNPLAIKEIANSAHMEGVLMPLVLAAVLLAMRRRPVGAMVALALAVGVKVWPVLLAPLLLRPCWGRWRTLLASAAVLCGLMALWLLPIWHGGLDSHSGFVAYAGEWQANGALLPLLRDSLKPVLASLSQPPELAGSLARALLAGVAAVTALACAVRTITTPYDLVQRTALITLVLVLVSPAQFPWYMLWTLPFLPLVPRLGVAAMAVMLPLYYLSFYFSAHGAYDVFRDRVVWLIWIPIWLVLAIESWSRRQHASASNAQSD